MFFQVVMDGDWYVRSSSLPVDLQLIPCSTHRMAIELARLYANTAPSLPTPRSQPWAQ